jgi:PEP-CTERM motif
LGAVIGYLGSDWVGITFDELFTSSSPAPLSSITIYDTSTSKVLAYTDTNFCTGCVTGVAVPTAAATPEPSSLLLFGTSLLGLLPFRRKLFGR